MERVTCAISEAPRPEDLSRSFIQCCGAAFEKASHHPTCAKVSKELIRDISVVGSSGQLASWGVVSRGGRLVIMPQLGYLPDLPHT